jgi:hypothetical protein
MSALEVVLLCVVGAVVAYVVGKRLFRRDEKMEDARRAAAQIASTLSSLGLEKTPEFLMDWVVKDYSAMVEKMIDLAKLLTSSPTAVTEEFGQVFDSVLASKLKTESGRAYIAAKLQDSCKSGDPGVVKDAPKAMVL